MICAKNYETVSKFVKVMPRILVASFFRTRCMKGKAALPGLPLQSALWTFTQPVGYWQWRS